jgi:hypothetical protein
MDTKKHPVLSSVATGLLLGAAFSVYAYFRFAHRSLYGTAVEGVGVAAMVSLLVCQQIRRSRLSEPIPELALVTPANAFLMVLGLVFVVFAVVARDWGYLAIAAPLCGTSLALVGLRYLGRWVPRRFKGR